MTPAQLRRENERLKAQIESLRESMSRGFGMDVRAVIDRADLQKRIEQAVKILTGEDE